MTVLTAMQVNAVDRNSQTFPAPDYYVTQTYTNLRYVWAISKVIRT